MGNLRNFFVLLAFVPALLQAQVSKTDTLFNSRGSIMSITTVAGNDSTVSTYFNDGSAVREKNTYKKGLLNGPSLEYTKQGILRSSHFYDMGLQTGQWLDYNDDGVINTETNYAIIYRSKKRITVKQGNYRRYSYGNTLLEKGNYLEDQKQGLWVNYDENGIIQQKTNYIKGQKSGEHIEYANGTISKYKNYTINKAGASVLSGKTYRKFPNGKYEFKGNYYNGMQDGRQTEWYKNGKLHSIIDYKNGKLSGKRYNYFANGKIKEKSHFIAVKDTSKTATYHSFNDGVQEEYFANGKLKYTRTYKKGKKTGTWLEYFENGQLHSRSTYENDLEKGRHEVYAIDGKLRNLAQYIIVTDSNGHKRNLRQGEQLEYYENGNLSRRSFYKAGKEDSLHVEYFNNGTISNATLYRNGIQIRRMEKSLDGKSLTTLVTTEEKNWSDRETTRKTFYENRLTELKKEKGRFSLEQNYNSGLKSSSITHDRYGEFERFNIEATYFQTTQNLFTLRLVVGNELFINMRYNPDGSTNLIWFSYADTIRKYFDNVNEKYQTAKWIWALDGSVLEEMEAKNRRQVFAPESGSVFHMVNENLKFMADTALNGNYTLYYGENRVLANLNFTHNQLNGVCNIFYPNGDTMVSYFFNHGESKGWNASKYAGNLYEKIGFYSDNGLKKERKHFVRGKLSIRDLGSRKMNYYPNGYLSSDNKIDSTPQSWGPKFVKYPYSHKQAAVQEIRLKTTYFDNGKKSTKKYAVVPINGGSPVAYGPDSAWYNTGIVKQAGFYRNDSAVGIRYFYYPNGNIQSIIRYNNYKTVFMQTDQFDSTGKYLFSTSGKSTNYRSDNLNHPDAVLRRHWPGIADPLPQIKPQNLALLSGKLSYKNALNNAANSPLAWFADYNKISFTNYTVSSGREGKLHTLSLATDFPMMLGMPDSGRNNLRLILNPNYSPGFYSMQKIALLERKNFWVVNAEIPYFGIQFPTASYAAADEMMRAYQTSGEIGSDRKFPFIALYKNCSFEFDAKGHVSLKTHDTSPLLGQVLVRNKLLVHIEKATVDLDRDTDNFTFPDPGYYKQPRYNNPGLYEQRGYNNVDNSKVGNFTGLAVTKAVVTLSNISRQNKTVADSLTYYSTEMLMANADFYAKLELPVSFKLPKNGEFEPYITLFAKTRQGALVPVTLYQLQESMEVAGITVLKTALDQKTQKAIIYVKTQY